MRINPKMTHEEFVKMQNSVTELPFYVTRKVGNEFKVYVYITYYIEIKHSIICSANDNCTLCPLYSKEGNEEECYY